MAKMGRPKSMPTEVLRVSRDAYLMVQWIADAKRWPLLFTADALLRMVARDQYLELMPLIRHRKNTEDQNAKHVGKDPLPLPEILVQHPDSKELVTPESLTPEEFERFWAKHQRLEPREISGFGRITPEIGERAKKHLQDEEAATPESLLKTTKAKHPIDKDGVPYPGSGIPTEEQIQAMTSEEILAMLSGLTEEESRQIRGLDVMKSKLTTAEIVEALKSNKAPKKQLKPSKRKK